METMNLWSRNSYREDKILSLMLKDILVCKINYKTGKVILVEANLLPFDIYLEDTTDVDGLVNNILNFNSWCSSRILSLDREYAKEILNSCNLSQATSDSERAIIALKFRCLSLRDFYWIKHEEDTKCWKEVCLYRNSLKNTVIDLSLRGINLTITNQQLISADLATDGVFPKAWYRTDENKFLLYKGEKNDSVKKEVEASKILQKLGLNVLDYNYGVWDGEQVAVSSCFTDENNAYITAEYFQIALMNEDSSLREVLEDYKIEYYTMVLADYLVGNADRHAGNWGFIYDTEKRIKSLAPIFDFNHAFEAEVTNTCLPEQLMGNKITSLEAAKIALKYVNIKEQGLSDFYYGDYVLERIKLLR